MRRLPLFCLLALFMTALCLSARPGASYARQDREQPSSAASRTHPAGTDALGRDRMTRVAVASLLCMMGAVAAAAVTTGIAATIGLLAALGPRLLAGALLLVCDTFLALPWLFLLMMVRAGLPLHTAPIASATLTFLLLSLLGWPACARAVHAGATAMRAADWMVQARTAGLRTTQLMRRHLLPQIGPLLLPQFLISIPAFVMAEANLGTLGLGVSEPLPSWGAMLLELDNSAMLVSSYWVYLPVALLILSLVLFELLLVEA